MNTYMGEKRQTQALASTWSPESLLRGRKKGTLLYISDELIRVNITVLCRLESKLGFASKASTQYQAVLPLTAEVRFRRMFPTMKGTNISLMRS